MHNLIFREADRNDLEAIANIHNLNVRGENTSSESGFLLTQISEDELLKNLEHPGQYFVATKADGEIVGFVTLLKPIISDEILNTIIWKDELFKQKVTSDNHLYIKIVATKSDYMGKGVAQFMYESVYKKFPNSFFSAFVVTKPISNTSSLIFHQKQGFAQVGILKIEQFLDLKNYESILFFKKT